MLPGNTRASQPLTAAWYVDVPVACHPCASSSASLTKQNAAVIIQDDVGEPEAQVTREESDDASDDTPDDDEEEEPEEEPDEPDGQLFTVGNAAGASSQASNIGNPAETLNVQTPAATNPTDAVGSSKRSEVMQAVRIYLHDNPEPIILPKGSTLRPSTGSTVVVQLPAGAQLLPDKRSFLVQGSVAVTAPPASAPSTGSLASTPPPRNSYASDEHDAKLFKGVVFQLPPGCVGQPDGSFVVLSSMTLTVRKMPGGKAGWEDPTQRLVGGKQKKLKAGLGRLLEVCKRAHPDKMRALPEGFPITYPKGFK
eukprot:jgi/Mesvir1/3234/Mv16377-RA.1